MSATANHSSYIAVQEKTNILPLFFLDPAVPGVTALAIYETINKGAVRHAAGNALAPVVVPLCGFFMEVVNPALAIIFETIGQAIYDYLGLDLVDKIAMRIINGGMANRYQLITRLFGDVFGRIQNAFRGVAR